MAQDVIVIGAGIIGCAIAYELSSRGAKVAVIDRRRVGQGATQASAGMLAPYLEAHPDSPMLDLGVRSLSLYPPFLQRVERELDRPVALHRKGTLEVAMDEEAWARLQASAQRTDRVAKTLFDARDLQAAEPALAPDVLGGLLVSENGFVDAEALTLALADAAAARGASFVTDRTVEQIDGAAAGVAVTTNAERFTAATAVLAAGSWSSQIRIPAGETVPVRPVRGQLVTLGWSAPPLGHITWGPRCYLVPRDDGSLLVGATTEEAGFDERATVAGVRDLLDAACDLVPAAWQAAFSRVKVGLRPGTPDDMPVVGPSRRLEGLVYATGHYRNGVLLAPLTAILVADYIVDGRSDPAFDSMGIDRFARSPADA